MAGMMPLFVAAPRVVLKVADVVIGYAIGLRVNVTLDIERVKILGQFEPIAIEPMFLPPCSGTFRVVRLLSFDSRTANSAAAVATRDNNVLDPKVTDNDPFGSAVAVAPAASGSLTEPASGSVLGQGALSRHLDPEKILYSQTFDMDLYIKVPNIAASHIGTGNILNADAPIITGTATDVYFEEHFLKVKDCRLSGASVDLTPGRLLEEPFSFEGLIAQTMRAGVAQQDLDTTWSEQP